MKSIDLHTHYLPKGYVAALEKHIPGNPDGWPTPSWKVEDTLELMARHDIEYSVLSLSSPHINFGSRNETIELAEEANELGKELTESYPDQIGYFASLPLPYVNETLRTVERATKEQKALGFTVPTNSRGAYFGSEVFDEVYEQLNEQKAIVALHPNQPQLPMNATIDLPIPLMGFFFDTTMTMLKLFQTHFFEKYPDIKLIVPHAGAVMPILTDRVAGYFQNKEGIDVYDISKKLYFDTAGRVLPRQLPALMTLADPNHIVYGSDAPYTDKKSVDLLHQELTQTNLISEDEKQKIFYQNGSILLNSLSE
ncbi:amidohydrolase family protein [Enterococcus thailandicus]|uniref:amidohydrolase family protein n=1 Tax=Enterococcus thailandicus TaxID=417368 RepID=UPI0022EBE0E9|nr:amidohydrolase family protein [Enterococcus thailandicus]MDA3974088.1 amidohydrolase family protein [Enterococcus thailandicus]MDA3976750.1 amidohydrolase family protein [Enterococcus thailandicus]MDA3981542.1 amidohydrolase family protein [Enterococcus thailandicus]